MTVMCRPAVSVVAPCFDEEDVLPLFLARVGGVLDSLGDTGEIVLVTMVRATERGNSSTRRQWKIRASLACG
jgi:hypothetical protein